MNRSNSRKSIKDYDTEIRKLASDNLHCRAIARQLEINPKSLSYYLRKNNIQVIDGKNTVASNNFKLAEIKRLYTECLTYEEIANLLSINSKSVQKYVNKLGLSKRTPLESYRNRYTINNLAFKEQSLDTAYWLGWIVTDGNLSDNGSISLSLKAEDAYIVEAFKQYMGSNAKCHYTEYFHKQCNKKVKQVSFSVMSKEVALTLKEYGIESRKTCKEKLPNIEWLKDECAAVFWRACLEGDGYVSKNFKQPALSLVGSEELLNSFREYCEKVCGVKQGKQLGKRRTGNPDFRTIEYTGISCRKILRKLWAYGNTFLKRKQDRVKAVIEHWKHEET